ncbi:uncharacterized protein METZ01_LOCUS456084, partial [marine metagenome]
VGRQQPIILKGGHVVDPTQGVNELCDLRIANGVVEQVGPDLGVDGAAVIEVPADLIVCPGFIDMHVHLREPGQEYKERIATGVEAAVAGGFVGVACMPNTNPVNDHRAVT